MVISDKLKTFLKVIKITSVLGGTGVFVCYNIRQTCKTVNRIVNPHVLDREKKIIPEYIYIDDPSYSETLKLEKDKESKQSAGLFRLWKFLKYSLAWRLLWLCRHGNKEQRNVALQQLASFKNNKNWDCLKLAQALDENTAVLLARTCGADLRYFLPPPIHIRRAALTKELMSFKLRDVIAAVQLAKPHSCIQHFLSKHFTNIQEQAMEVDSFPIKPDNISERDLCFQCLDAIHHHISLFHSKDYKDDVAAQALINSGILMKLAELLLRYKNDTEIDLVVLKILTVLSIHKELLKPIFENGLIGQLSRMIKADDARLSSSAASCLANLSGEDCFRPGLYLLHPLYRVTTQPSCDILLVHGLRGGVFVTWRQRDRKCNEPLGIIDVTVSDVEYDPLKDNDLQNTFLDLEFQNVIEDLKEIEEERTLYDFEVVLHDLPCEAKRDYINTDYLTSHHKRACLKQEMEDRASHTLCWPKDWLPQDCSNLRILGVNYWSYLSEWLERCPLQNADIATRASEIAPALIDAGVGKNNVPVVWLAHSMGGLIVKQLLSKSAESSDEIYKYISENTKAILFYSTPHRGSALASMPRAAAAVLWPSTDVQQLQENSPTLLDLQASFLKFTDFYNWEIISFAESMPTLVTAFKVPIHFVEAFSADLGRGVFYELPLDHLSICKPATRQSILYTTVLDVLHRVTTTCVPLSKYNSYMGWIFELVNSSLKLKPKEFKQLGETSSNEELRWHDRLTTDAFTDGLKN